MARPDRLDLFHGEDHVAFIYDSSPLEFEYAPDWLARAERLPVAAIPPSPGRQHCDAVQVFLENLLPEGELRAYITEQKKASTLFSLLYEVAGDTAGGFVILPGGERPQPASYEATTWQALADFLGSKSASAIDIKGRHARVSLAGAQDKASIALFEDGIPRLPQGTSPSTHILKPDIRRLAKVWHSAANEAVIMRAAALCRLPTADVFYEPLTQACVVKRLDRIQRPDGALGRLLQYDLCQLAGTVSEKKYETEGGPGAGRCAELIRQYSVQPAVDPSVRRQDAGAARTAIRGVDDAANDQATVASGLITKTRPKARYCLRLKRFTSPPPAPFPGTCSSSPTRCRTSSRA
ncbi:MULTISPECIES: HipA domain-containing protein [unclassified Variovorax]|uniref:HipA domain-containing protein n=1 Tax=unclassified Variovorax TaxID=663243 RepID=UPI003ECC6BA1